MPVSAETTLPTCYRHADRETRLSCSSCGRPTCVECVRSAAVGQKCVECAAPQPGARVIDARQIVQGGVRQLAPVTFWLIAACAAVFVASVALPAVSDLGRQSNAAVDAGQVWRLVTAAFLHDGILHIGFNMYALYLFGPGLERQVGGPAFLALYLGSAIAGGAAYFLPYALEIGGLFPAVGASGAVFGLFGATLALTYRNRSTAAGAAGLRQLLTLLGINLALPLIAPGLGIAWQAHVGGLLAGVLIAAAWSLIGARQRAGALRAAAGVAVGLAAFAVVLVV